MYIDDHCTNEWALKVAGPWADFEHAGVQKLKSDPAHEVYPLTAAQLDEWKKAAQPLETITGKVNDFLAHIERKQREDLLQLVEKVTRQVIRCELALQPTQLLALVEEALAAFPVMPETLQVMLSTEEFNRLRDAVPEKVSEWGLTPSPDLPPGECRVITDKSELDIGCEHRLEQCMTALKETLTPESQGE